MVGSVSRKLGKKGSQKWLNSDIKISIYICMHLINLWHHKLQYGQTAQIVQYYILKKICHREKIINLPS